MSGTSLDLQSVTGIFSNWSKPCLFSKEWPAETASAAYSPHSTQIHSSFSPLRCRDLLK